MKNSDLQKIQNYLSKRNIQYEVIEMADTVFRGRDDKEFRRHNHKVKFKDFVIEYVDGEALRSNMPYVYEFTDSHLKVLNFIRFAL